MSGYLKEGIKFFHPLSLNDRLLIDTVTTRYGDLNAPFISIDRGDHTELRCPEIVRRLTPWETKTCANR